MINVKVSYSKGQFVSLEAKGHADSAPYGKDLICAAISAIILGGFNALKDGDKNYEVQVNAGLATLSRKLGKNSEHDETVLETIVTQIASVASSYPKNVKLERINEK
jgi:uncharacterized protein YsxB (DUF464 family)